MQSEMNLWESPQTNSCDRRMLLDIPMGHFSAPGQYESGWGAL